MGWLSNIFGGQDTASQTIGIIGDSIKGIGNWIDEKDFTPEEKSIALQKAVDTHLKLIESTKDENSIRSITRRWIACTIVIYMLLMTTFGTIFAVLDKPEKAKIVFNSIELLGTNMVLLAIIGFYFGVQFLRNR